MGETHLSFPAVNESSSVEVGEAMIYDQTAGRMGIVTEVRGPFTVSGKLGAADFTLTVPDKPLVKKPGAFNLTPSEIDFRYGRDKGPRSFGRPDTLFSVISPTKLSLRIDYGLGKVDFVVPDAHVTFNECLSFGASSFRRELVYGGVAKGVVTLTYREFKGDFARPAFTQTLTYDLADGREIGFRGARFRIDEATNLEIKYTVLKPLTGA